MPFTVSPRLDLPGFGLGHGTDLAGKTGVTVVLVPEGATAAAEVRGSATGTRQLDSLVSAEHVASRAHAFVLAGGSGFGLAAADPVVDWLEAGGYGFDARIARVPLVPTAILFDLGFGDPAARPGERVVEEAIRAAAAGLEGGAGFEVPVGSVGAGTGATVGKARGSDHAMKGGVGFAAIAVEGGPRVAAVVAVNAFGDVRDLAGRTVAGCRTAPDALELAGAEEHLVALPPERANPWRGNTTLAVVMTDADLPKAELLKVCRMAFGGLYRTLAPALSLFDGDLVATLSTRTAPAHLNQVGILAENAVARAVLSAVTAAHGFGILPAVRDLEAEGGG